jgi:hypothetical protein
MQAKNKEAVLAAHAKKANGRRRQRDRKRNEERASEAAKIAALKAESQRVAQLIAEQAANPVVDAPRAKKPRRKARLDELDAEIAAWVPPVEPAGPTPGSPLAPGPDENAKSQPKHRHINRRPLPPAPAVEEGCQLTPEERRLELKRALRQKINGQIDGRMARSASAAPQVDPKLRRKMSKSCRKGDLRGALEKAGFGQDPGLCDALTAAHANGQIDSAASAQHYVAQYLMARSAAAAGP